MREDGISDKGEIPRRLKTADYRKRGGFKINIRLRLARSSRQ